MKIKRLTAALAVAAMAAGFTLASPMLSANAASPTPIAASSTQAYDIYGQQVAGGDTLKINIFNTLLADTNNANTDAFLSNIYASGQNETVATMSLITVGTGNTVPGGNLISSWDCNNALVYDSTGTKKLDNFGYLSCDTSGNLIYTPSLAMGANGGINVVIYYEATAQLTPAGYGYPAIQIPAFNGLIHVTVTAPVAKSNCDTSRYDAKCLSADVQAFGKKDKANSVTVNLLTPNIFNATSNPTGVITAADQPVMWGLSAVNNPSSVDVSLMPPALANLVTYSQAKGANSVTFTPPANWSGTVVYEYVLGSYSGPGGRLDDTKTHLGMVTFTVHPTLPALDDITSDQGAKVTVPVLEQSIIGSKPFSNASCTFANTKSKTTVTGTGTISNKSGSKDPIFTPDPAFVGSVDLSCTVQDTFGITSNTVTVTIQVGVVAPAPVVPAAPATPACTTCNGGTLVSTGGSLAAPMSSGLAAVVLLVAAGAGILVVRRRTVLAG